MCPRKFIRIFCNFLKEMCDQYWPKSFDPVPYGDVEVTLVNENRNPCWTTTELKVCNVSLFYKISRNFIDFVPKVTRCSNQSSKQLSSFFVPLFIR